MRTEPKPYILATQPSTGRLVVLDGDPDDMANANHVAYVERVILKHEGDRAYKGCLVFDTDPKPGEGETMVGIPFDPRRLYTEPWFRSIRAGKKWGKEVGTEVVSEGEYFDALDA